MSISVVILAGGAGTRMKSDLPKVLHKISGYPMISYAVEAAQAVSDDVQVILYHQKELIGSFLDKNFQNLTICTQDHKNFPGTGGAIMAAKPKNSRVVVINGDMPLISSEFLKQFAEVEADVSLAVFEHPNPTGYGRVVIEADQVQKIVEEKDANEAEKLIKAVNGGVYSFERNFLEKYLKELNNNNSQKEYYITDLISIAKDNNRSIKAFYADSKTLMGVNSKYELSIAEKNHQDKIKSDLMRSGVIMHLPDTVFVDPKATFEGECEIDSGVLISGKCTIKNSHIKTNSVVENSTIIDSDIGPLARIRPDSVIEKSHIGNFVEIKNSQLLDTKAGHLSYIGDAVIGSGTNIGAGTITCNYDGKNKHKTVIGKNVFVGSDTQIVAPVNIPDDVMIAAGTTITKDPKSGDLVLSRSPQKSIANFFYKFFGK